jgi:hypothetical protein
VSKIKIRCSQCGKSFKSTNPKQLICPECEEKARRERAAKAKGLPQPASAPTPAPRPMVATKPTRPVAPTAAPKQHWLDQQPDVKIGAAEPRESARPPRLDIPERRPPSPFQASSAPTAAGSARSAPVAPGQARPPLQGRQAPSGSATLPHDQKTRRPGGQKKGEGERPKGIKRVPQPRPKREPRQPTPPFAPTPEQVTVIEERYTELAQPGEFDGIRSQISKELGIPKSAVKKVVAALRARQDIPSWWDLQPYHGSPDDLERIRSVYLPLLPTPTVGVHKQIALQLSLPAGTVYQAIKVIRAEMNLPQYNPPDQPGAALEA